MKNFILKFLSLILLSLHGHVAASTESTDNNNKQKYSYHSNRITNSIQADLSKKLAQKTKPDWEQSLLMLEFHNKHAKSTASTDKKNGQK